MRIETALLRIGERPLQLWLLQPGPFLQTTLNGLSFLSTRLQSWFGHISSLVHTFLTGAFLSQSWLSHPGPFLQMILWFLLLARCWRRNSLSLDVDRSEVANILFCALEDLIDLRKPVREMRKEEFRLASEFTVLL
jgi:hypothetical protein